MALSPFRNTAQNPKTKPVTTRQLDAATAVSHKTTTTTIPALTNTAAPAIYETTIMPDGLDHVANTCHIITLSTTIPAQPELKPTTTAAILNTVIEQRGNMEQERRKGMQEGV